jgi:hypothetical protein
VTVIFLSEIIWEKFRPNTGCFEPFVLYFPDYSIGKFQLFEQIILVKIFIQNVKLQNVRLKYHQLLLSVSNKMLLFLHFTTVKGAILIVTK